MQVISPPKTFEVTSCNQCWFADHDRMVCSLIRSQSWYDRTTGEASLKLPEHWHDPIQPLPHCPLREGPIVIKLKK
jgi:hypothetical protein